MDVGVKFLSKKERERLKNEREELEKAKLEDQLSSATKEKVQTSSAPTTMPKSDLPVIPFHIRKEEIEAIKNSYLNPARNNSSRGRIADRKFHFEWNEEDDTSKDSSKFLASLPVPPPTTMNAKRKAADYLLPKRDERLHWREKSLMEMRDRDWRILKEDFHIATKGGSIPNPLRYWREASISQDILDALRKFSYYEPSAIQRQAIPIITQGRDMLGVAETGSGKTVAFLVPLFEILDRTYYDNPVAHQGPFALILAPTRELVLQIEAECARFAKFLGKRPPVAVVGGHSMAEQSFRLSRGVDIVVATPGRLKDCLEQHILSLEHVTYTVFDEADRMVDMGFEADLSFILSKLRPSASNRASLADHFASSNTKSRRGPQMIMFSATMPPAVERLVRTYLSNPATVTIGIIGQVVDTIEQKVELMQESQKRNRLFALLETVAITGPVIVFANLKDTIDSLVRHMTSRGFGVIGLHGGKSQEQRESALSKLKSGKVNILVATDVASRGIDVPDVALVVNFDMASSIETYIHRIGRTGRAGKAGLAYTFLTQENAPLFYDLKALLLSSPRSTCPPELAFHEAANVKPGSFIQKKKSDETIFK